VLICHPKQDLGYGNFIGISFSLNSLLEGWFATEGDGITTDFDGDMGEMRG
jgi:hypothetical protein